LKPLTANPNARALYRHYRKSARKRGHVFELTLEVFVDVTQHNCYLCGIEPSQVHRDNSRDKSIVNNPFIYNGIDRVDNKLGYIIGNLATACSSCNMVKRFGNVEQFLLYIKRAYEYNFGTEVSNEVENESSAKKKPRNRRAVKDKAARLGPTRPAKRRLD
jgi:hypothetical protein